MTELDFAWDVEDDAPAANYPTDEDYQIDINLGKLKARANSNVESLAKRINNLYLLELFCVEVQKSFPQLEPQYSEIFKCHNSTCVIKEVVNKL